MLKAPGLEDHLHSLTEHPAILDPMQLQEILYSQGFGTRRICAGLVQQGLVKFDLGAGLVNVIDTNAMVTAVRSHTSANHAARRCSAVWLRGSSA